jgi:hypothetical protein
LNALASATVVDHPDRPDVIGDINAAIRHVMLTTKSQRRTQRDIGCGITITIKRLSRMMFLLEIQADEEWVWELLDHRSAELIDPSLPEDGDQCFADKELWPDRDYDNVFWVTFYIDRLGAPGYMRLSTD